MTGGGGLGCSSTAPSLPKWLLGYLLPYYLGTYIYTSDLLHLQRQVSSARPVLQCLLVVLTPLRVQKWATLLRYYPDTELVDYRLGGIRQGFWVGFKATSKLRSAKTNFPQCSITAKSERSLFLIGMWCCGRLVVDRRSYIRRRNVLCSLGMTSKLLICTPGNCCGSKALAFARELTRHPSICGPPLMVGHILGILEWNVNAAAIQAYIPRYGIGIRRPRQMGLWSILGNAVAATLLGGQMGCG